MSRLALKAAADAGRQLVQPGCPWDNTTSLGRPQIIVYGDLTTHTTIDAVEEPATHILGQMAARRATQLPAGWAVPSGPGRCRRDGRARCAATRGSGTGRSEESDVHPRLQLAIIWLDGTVPQGPGPIAAC